MKRAIMVARDPADRNSALVRGGAPARLRGRKDTQRGRGDTLRSSGAADIYFTTTNKIKQWDTCASYCLIMEAGGKMTDMLGNDLEYNTEKLNHEHGLLVSNGLIHNQIIDIYREFTNNNEK